MTSHPPHPSAQNPEGAKRPAARRTAIAPPAMRAWMTSLLFALCMGLVPMEGWASCTLTPDSAPRDDKGVILYFPAFNISIPNPNVAVGTVLTSPADQELSRTSGRHSCPTAFRYAGRGTTGTPVTAGNQTNVYPTSIPGIGIRITYPGSFTFPYLVTNATSNPGTLYWNTNAQGGQKLRIQLIKTGPITAGGTLTGEFAGVFAVENSGSGPETQIASFRFSPGTVISPNVPTCTVETPSIAVDMGTVAAGDFQGVGSNAGARKDFDINLSCSGGATGTVTNVHITLTDQTNPANTGDVLTLDPVTSTASGTGLNIFKGSTTEKVKFGPDSSAAGNLNQWSAGQVNQGTTSFSIPLSVQYVQTGSTVTAGTANATATFTMSYQ